MSQAPAEYESRVHQEYLNILVSLAPVDIIRNVTRTLEMALPAVDLEYQKGTARGIIRLRDEMDARMRKYRESDTPPITRYTLEEVKAAFRKEFHGAGEMSITYLGSPKENTESTESIWQSFAEHLGVKVEEVPSES